MYKSLLILLILALPAIYFNVFSEKENVKSNKISKFDLAFYRAEHEFMKTRDPNSNKIPVGIREKELQFIRKIPSANDFYRANKNVYPFVQTQKWVSSGPVNIAGRMKDIEFDILNHSRIICGSASGGVWVSEDSGSNWTKTNSPLSEQSVYCIEQDRRNGKTNVWYYGTGELLSTTNRQFTVLERTVGMGNGIYKSTDNGYNWFLLESTKVLDNSSLNDVFQGIWDIKTDFNINEKDIVYAACYGGVMRSEDAGRSWIPIISDMNNKCFSSDIEITSTKMYYAALSALTNGPGLCTKRGIYRSKDGIVWKDITPQGFPEDTRVVKIQSAPSNGNVLYVLTESPRANPDPFFSFASSHHSFWKYTYSPEEDRGGWEDRTINLPNQDIKDMNQVLQRGFNSLGGYCITLNIKPDDENCVFIGGTNLFRSDNAFASPNSKKIGGYSTYLHPDQHENEFLPGDPKIMYNASDGGITMTKNCSDINDVAWFDKNNGLVTAQFYSIALDHNSSDDYVLAGGLQDQGTLMKIHSISDKWLQIFGGDGLSTYIANDKNYIIASLYNGMLFSGLFTGETFQISGNIYNSLLISDELYNMDINFFTIFDVEPNDNDELYIAVNNSIYRKMNLIQSISNPNYRNLYWEKMNSSLVAEGVNVTAIELSKTPKHRLYYGTDNGKVYRIDDANGKNTNRIDISDDKFPINGFVSCIVADPYDADKLFVTFSNYNVQSIFYSTDGGASWTIQGGNLEENPDGGGAGPSIRCMEILHLNGETIYFAGTSSGLFSTRSLQGVNTVWVHESPDLIGNIKIDMITARQIDGFVAVATQGNGVYTTTASTDINQYNLGLADMQLHLYPNPVSENVHFLLDVQNSGFYELFIYDFNGELIESVMRKYLSNGKHILEYSLSKYPNGSYFYILSNQKSSKKGKFIISK